MRHVIAAVVLLVVPAPAFAQDTMQARSLLQRRVRIEAPGLTGERFEGRIVAIDSVGLVLRLPVADRAIARTDITRIENVRRGDKAGRAMGGLLLGGIVGFLVVKTWADLTYENDEWNVLGALVYGAPPGALIGLIVGISTGREEWREIKIREWIGSDH